MQKYEYNPMKYKMFFLLFLLMSKFSFSQVKISGEWLGLMIQNSDSIKNGKPVYFYFYLVNGLLEGKFRQELYGTLDFSIATFTGSVSKQKKIDFQLKSYSKSQNSELLSCLFQFNVRYNDTTGYIEGTYSNSKCPNLTGKVLLYKSKYEFREGSTPLVSHNWIDRFISDIENGLSSPDMRQKELKEFRFESIYFDYDKDFIKEEYTNYLENMVKIVKGHSDIRIKITGNTDSDGGEPYNDALSKRRAEALILFFQKHGLSRDRIVLDYKGEKNPIDTNKTNEGKKKNRRVEFEFI